MKNMFVKGYKQTEEHKRKRSEAMKIAQKGNRNHLGHKHSDEIRKKISLAVKGKTKGVKKPPRSETHLRNLKLAWIERKKKNFVHPFKGKHHSQETIDKIIKKTKGRLSWNTGKKCPELAGENCHLWKGGITPINQKIRTSLEYKLWRESVFKRDNFTCIFCGDNTGNNLEADHIKPFSQYPELRFAIDNGRTLCHDCHTKTNTYGSKLYSLNK